MFSRQLESSIYENIVEYPKASLLFLLSNWSILQN